MATEHTDTTGAEGTERNDDAGLRSRAVRAASGFTNRGGNGRAAMTVGSFLLARAARTFRRSRRRAVAMGLAGAALLGIGLRQRRSGSESGGGDVSAVDTEGSAEATAHLEQSSVLHQAETNPRGTSGEPDVEMEPEPTPAEDALHMQAGVPDDGSGDEEESDATAGDREDEDE